MTESGCESASLPWPPPSPTPKTRSPRRWSAWLTSGRTTPRGCGRARPRPGSLPRWNVAGRPSSASRAVPFRSLPRRSVACQTTDAWPVSAACLGPAGHTPGMARESGPRRAGAARRGPRPPGGHRGGETMTHQAVTSRGLSGTRREAGWARQPGTLNLRLVRQPQPQGSPERPDSPGPDPGDPAAMSGPSVVTGHRGSVPAASRSAGHRRLRLACAGIRRA